MITDIAQLRLTNQHIALTSFSKAEEVVDWLGAVQAQDYFGAKWALGLRTRNSIDKDIEEAFNDGLILRTHLLRPTWHFVRPADIRWMLALTAPRVHAASAYMYRRMELDGDTFQRSDAILANALVGGKHLTRNELRGVLENAGIATDNGTRMSYLMMHAELEEIVCSGPRRGKQFTYALLEERASGARTLDRDGALAELSRRFFRSRGPATVQDFAKWSGLTVADASSGLEAVKSGLDQETLDGQSYWFLRPRAPIQTTTPTAHLLSVYDEYISGYKDRSAMDDGKFSDLFNAMGNNLQYIIILDGRFAGTWKRTIKKNVVIIELNSFNKLTKTEEQAVSQAAQRYGAFLELPVVMA
jgi:DNA glycosylase AlkZ-like